MVATSSAAAAVDQRTFIIHMDTTKMPATDPEQWYTSMIHSVNELPSLNTDEGEASNTAEVLYVYKTALSGNILNIDVSL